MSKFLKWCGFVLVFLWFVLICGTSIDNYISEVANNKVMDVPCFDKFGNEIQGVMCTKDVKDMNLIVADSLIIFVLGNFVTVWLFIMVSGRFL